MINTPYTGLEDTTIRVKLTLNGSDMKEAYGIQSVNIHHAINKISTAELVLICEVEIDSNEIPITDSDDFNPGVEIEIFAGYNGKSISSIFKGIIARHSVEISKESDYSFRILCKHEAVKMTYNQRERYFENQPDNTIIETIMAGYGIGCKVTACSEVYENRYQRMATDWDFILARCRFNGFIVCLDGDAVSIGKPNVDAVAVLKIEAGISIISFNGTLNAEYQPSGIEASAWDTKTLSLIKTTAAAPGMNKQGNIPPGDLSSKLPQDQLKIISTNPMTSSELQTWADGNLLRKRLSAFEGSVKFIGNETVKTGSIIGIGGVGKKLEGQAFVSAVSHSIDSGNWDTTVFFGLENIPVQEGPHFSYTAAGGQLPAMQGLQLATVKKTDQDPIGSYRVQVEIPSNSATPVTIWARMANFYASDNAGSFFLPEAGDEVVLGFFDNDPRFPVILGSLHNGKSAPPYTADNGNNIKSIVTRSRMKIEFDEAKKSILLATPASNTIVISDDGKTIEIKDQNSNHIRLSPGGISICSETDINISAKGNINIDAGANLSIKTTQDLALSGLNINAAATIGFTARADATAELSAAGQTTVKGGMVMIN